MSEFAKQFLKRQLGRIALVILLTSVCLSCYRMPTDDDCSLVPTTNNPDVTGTHGGGLVPGGNF